MQEDKGWERGEREKRLCESIFEDGNLERKESTKFVHLAKKVKERHVGTRKVLKVTCFLKNR